MNSLLEHLEGKGDRLPPNSPEAEQGVLGCILLAPSDSIAQCVETIKSSDFFYDLRHQAVYEAALDMFDKREAIDIITLQQCLKDRKQLDAVGGIAYLSTLPDTVPSAANITYYLDILLEKYQLRRMVAICTSAVGMVYEGGGNHQTLIEDTEKQLLTLVAGPAIGNITIKNAVRQAIDTIESYHQGKGIHGIASGFPDLDKLTNGFKNGDMIVLAGRPSMGKTSLAMNMAEHVAIEQKLPVGVFSLEMTIDSLVMRLLCSRARVNMSDMREGFMTDRDFVKLTMAARQVANSPMHIDDSPGLSILQLRSRARRMQQLHGIKLFVIDYLQLLHGSGRKHDGRQVEMTEVSNGVKNIAKELGVPVIALSQLNRELDKDKSRKPRLSDLRETGAIEQDADLIGMLYRPGEDESVVHLLIPKQRNGPTGDVPLVFLKPFTRFESSAKIGQEDLI